MDTETESEKVYVAVGNDLQDGFKTLDWTFKKWDPQAISLVILHVTCNTPKDFVYTPFGKLPASSVSDEKLEVLRKYEEGKIDKLLSTYRAFCGKVKSEILKVEKYDDPIQKLMLDLISGLKITKLVMGITFMKSSIWKSKSAISGSFYIHQHKPDFCEFYIICGGKSVLLKGENEEGIIMEGGGGDHQGKIREKSNFKTWLSRRFSENSSYSIGRNSKFSGSSKSLNSPGSEENQWEKNVQDIENYFQKLLSLNLDEENIEEDDGVLETSPMEENVGSNMSVVEKMEALRSKINEAHEIIQLKRKEAKANADRYTKAEWAICLCNSRAEQLEAPIKEEVTNRTEIQKDLDNEKEQLYKTTTDVEENKHRLNSLAQLQSELSNKLRVLTMAKGNAQTQLEKAVTTRAGMVREVEELRRQRDVLNRRVEFCRENDERSTSDDELITLSCGYKEYTAEDIIIATDDFSQRLRLKTGEDSKNVYRGRINCATAAIKMADSSQRLSHEDFQAKVELLNNIRHPHLVAMTGFCSELQCIIFEYMHNGNLRDILLTSQGNHKKRIRVLKWHDRFRIAHEVCSGLSFLHLAEPKPIVHGNLILSNILLDCNLVAKITGFGLANCYDLKSDVKAFGVLLLHLLTGRNWEDTMALDQTAVVRVLDETAGEWPVDLAEKLAGMAMKCLSVDTNNGLRITSVMEELDEMRKTADDLVARGACEVVRNKDDSNDVPSVFLCPIFQEVMKSPHVAADGFSYELEAIEEWLGMGHDTSPMTNLKLKHNFLTPNHTLRSLIQDWHNRKSSAP